MAAKQAQAAGEPPIERQLLTIDEAAKALGVGVDTVTSLANVGVLIRLPKAMIGRSVRYHPDDIRALARLLRGT